MATVILKLGVGGIALAAALIPAAEQNATPQQMKPVVVGTMTSDQTFRPIVTVVGGRTFRGWPGNLEGEGHTFPMPLPSIPPGWITPLAMAPLSWRVFLNDGRRLTVRAIDVVRLSDENPVLAAIRTTRIPEWSARSSGVAVAGAAPSVNFIQSRFDAAESARLTTIARQLTLNDVLRAMAVELDRMAEPEREAIYRPSRQEVLESPIEPTIYRPERPLADGLRPVLVDYMLRFEGTPGECLTQIHVRSWFHEGRRGLVRALGTEVVADFGCGYMTVDAFPDVIVTIGDLELWLGQNYYEDGFEDDAYHFRNGRLESVTAMPSDGDGDSRNGRPWSGGGENTRHLLLDPRRLVPRPGSASRERLIAGGRHAQVIRGPAAARSRRRTGTGAGQGTPATARRGAPAVRSVAGRPSAVGDTEPQKLRRWRSMIGPVRSTSTSTP